MGDPVYKRISIAKYTTPKLTARQIEILLLVEKGLRSQEIANSLYIDRRTVEYHLAEISGRLNTHSRTQSVHEARRLGLLKTSPAEG